MCVGTRQVVVSETYMSDIGMEGKNADFDQNDQT